MDFQKNWQGIFVKSSFFVQALGNAGIQARMWFKSLPSMALDSASPWRNDGFSLT